ncbi:class I adenylate-forming enzyme family protein [Pseudonocardia spinosispora]|uniref:class I adenylate-forming enzyme family protein n=1 Tax=Pseudonocardia spinosispora TaxID=103441 RepID=UPI000412D0FF|nr:AMP-binding protein [Pseudonocardia spinosispora]
MNLAETCEFWARWQPEAVAMSQSGRHRTWSELEERTRRIAVGLRGKGVTAGDRVGILGANALSWCELAIGILRAGAVVVPLNVRATTSELAYMVDAVSLSAIAHDATLVDRYEPLAAERPNTLRIALDDRAPSDITLSALAAQGHDLDPTIVAGIAGSDPAVVAFTSGTTGYPKGAVLTHDNVFATANNYTRTEGWDSGTAMLCCVPLAFTGGVINNFLITFVVGGTLLLEEFDPVTALNLIVSWPVNAMTGVPIMYEGIASAPGFDSADLSSLGTAITGGALVPAPLLRRYEAKGVYIRQAYSLTEATASTTVLPRSHFLSKRDAAGLPAPHTRVRIVDGGRREVPVGEVGEIAVSGPQVCAGYWGDPEASSAAVADGWLYTGDMGTVDADGFLRVVDRKKDMIISGGLNVYPAEIERVVGEFPGVGEVAAVGTDHERWGETVAVVIGGPGVADVDLAKLHEHCRTHLADYKLPRYIVRSTEALPRSMSGKVLRRVLRDGLDTSVAHRTPAR